MYFDRRNFSAFKPAFVAASVFLGTTSLSAEDSRATSQMQSANANATETQTSNSDSPKADAKPATHPAQESINEAVAAYRDGDVDQALNLFRVAVKSHPDLPPAEVLMAHVGISQNKYNAAYESLQQAAISVPHDPEVWNLLGDLAQQSGRLAEAESLYMRANSTCRSFDADMERKARLEKNSLTGLATVYERRSQWESAIDQITILRNLDTQAVAPLKHLARVQLRAGRVVEATGTLNEVRELDANEPIAAIAIGQVYELLGDRQAAVDSMRDCLVSNTKDFQIGITIAQWALNVDENALFEEAVTTAEGVNPDAPQAAAMRGMAERFAGRSVNAEAIFQKLLNAHPSNFDAMNGLALSLLEQEDSAKHAKAVELARLLVGMNPTLQTSRGRTAAATLAWASHKKGNSELAEQLVLQLIQTGRVSPEIAFYCASVLAKSDSPQSDNKNLAGRLLQNAVQSKTRFPNAVEAKALLSSLETALH